MAEGESGGETGTGVVIPAAPSPAAAPESSPTDLVLKVLGAIGTGIGILGFVTFFGGAIVWVRADQAKLPATEVVSVVPRNVLITTGVNFLFPALLIAAGVVALVFLLHLGIRLREEDKVRPKRRQARERRKISAQTGRDAVAAQQVWKAASASLEVLKSDLATAGERKESKKVIAELEAKVRAQRIETEKLQERAERMVSAAATAKGTADNLIEESAENVERGWKQWAAELTLAGLGLLVAVPLINGAICHVSECGEAAALVAVAIAGTAITLLIYWKTQKFVWFGVVAFLAIGLYLALATYFSTHRNPKMQPVAALRTGHEPVVGSYVAATGESLYVGTFEEPGEPPRLVVIPRAQVTESVIGPLLDPGDAHQRAIEMAIDECAKQVEKKPAEDPAASQGSTTAQQPQPGAPTKKQKTEPKPEYEPACSDEQVEDLEAAQRRAAAQNRD